MSEFGAVEALERWTDHGANWRVLALGAHHAVVELRTCSGEPVDRLESDDPALLRYLVERGPASDEAS